MRIGLNLIHAQPEVGGVWNYISNLMDALGQCDQTNTYVSFVNKKSVHIVPKSPNFKTIIVNINPIIRGGRILYENAVLPVYANKIRLQCMHWFANVMPVHFSIPSVVSVYDLMAFRRPQYFFPLKRIYLQYLMKLTAIRANAFLPISETTGDDFKNILRPKKGKIWVLPAVIDEQFKPIHSEKLNEFIAKYNLPEIFFLYVAHTYPHKNHLKLLHAYSKLLRQKKNCWPLVLRGESNVSGNSKKGNENINSAIQKLGLEEKVIRLPRLRYRDLPLLYSSAGAVIFPSRFEGLGMPVLESMACGCPVAVSDLPVMREVAGNAALFFRHDSIDEIAFAMDTLQENQDLRDRMRTRGLERAQRFSRSAVIDTLLAVYKSICR